MGDNYLTYSRFVDEDDFTKRKTNLYAKINGEYYIKVSRKYPEELARINGILYFQYCRVRKIGEHNFIEEGKSKRYIVTEDVMTAEEFLNISSPYDPYAITIAEYLEDYEELIVCVNTFTDENGNKQKYASPLFCGEKEVYKPKSLKLQN